MAGITVVSLTSKLSRLIGQPDGDNQWLTADEIEAYALTQVLESETTLPLQRKAASLWIYDAAPFGGSRSRPLCFRFSNPEASAFTMPDAAKTYIANEFGPYIKCTDAQLTTASIDVLGCWIDIYEAGALMLEDLAAGRAMEIAAGMRDSNMTPGMVSSELLKRAANLRGSFGA